MKYIIIFFLILFSFSCTKESNSNLTLVDLTTNNIPPSQTTDTLSVRLTYYKDSSSYVIIALAKYTKFIGTGTNHFIDTIHYPDQFVRGEFVWKLSNINIVDSGFESFPIIPGTTKYINLNY